MQPVIVPLHRAAFEKALDGEVRLKHEQPASDRRRFLIPPQIAKRSQIRLIAGGKCWIELDDTAADRHRGFVVTLHQMDQYKEAVEEESMRIQRRQLLVAIVPPLRLVR